MKLAVVRDLTMIITMLVAFGFVQANPVSKASPAHQLELASLVPEQLPPAEPDWKSVTFDTADYSDQWQSINELLVRKYFQRDGANADLIIEYSSDVRQNFSFHFPENCHRSGGNEVDFLPPLQVTLPGGATLLAKLIFIRGLEGSVEPRDKLTAYWLVLDEKRYHETFWVKVDQMLAGLLKQARSGFLVRLDWTDGAEYSEESFAQGREFIAELVQDLYASVSLEDRAKLFGAELARN